MAIHGNCTKNSDIPWKTIRKNLTNEYKSIKYARRAIYANKDIEKFKIIDPSKIKEFTLYLRKNSVDTFRSFVGTMGNTNRYTFYDVS